jgi:hypothetical protein
MLGAFTPQKLRDLGLTSYQKIYACILAFIAGAEYLDDFDWLDKDPLFEKLASSPPQ